jgi:FkbM family methyltransferase
VAGRVATRGTVYAFEPDPELFECLEQNVRNNQLTNISAIRATASNCSGTLALSTNGLNRGDNRIDAKALHDTGMQQVQAVTLDEIVSDRCLDLLKIDVQGFEIEVLLGAQKTLSANPALTIVLNFGLTVFAELVTTQLNCGISCERPASRSLPWITMATDNRLRKRRFSGSERRSIAILSLDGNNAGPLIPPKPTPTGGNKKQTKVTEDKDFLCLLGYLLFKFH